MCQFPQLDERTACGDRGTAGDEVTDANVKSNAPLDAEKSDDLDEELKSNCTDSNDVERLETESVSSYELAPQMSFSNS